MIAQLTGRIVSLNYTELILDVNGVGYFVSIPMSTYDVLVKAGEGGTVTVLTWLQVREDALQLYGFAKKEELEIFKLLLTVNGIGAKTALVILSSMNIPAFCNAIVNADIKVLKHISGIGPRSAERSSRRTSRSRAKWRTPSLRSNSSDSSAPRSRRPSRTSSPPSPNRSVPAKTSSARPSASSTADRFSFLFLYKKKPGLLNSRGPGNFSCFSGARLTAAPPPEARRRPRGPCRPVPCGNPSASRRARRRTARASRRRAARRSCRPRNRR